MKKKTILDEIQNKELTAPALPEASPNELFKPIIIKTIPKVEFNIMPAFPHHAAREVINIFIGYCLNINSKARRFVIQCNLINGTKELCDSSMTHPTIGGTSAVWNETLTLPLQIKTIPRSARIAITLYDYDLLKTKKRSAAALATYNFPVFTFDGWLNTGWKRMNMWNGKDLDPILTTCESQDPAAIKIFFKIPQYKFPITFIKGDIHKSNSMRVSNELIQRCEKVYDKIKIDPLYALTKEDKEAIWHCRHHSICTTHALMLPRVLQSLDYTVPTQVIEIPGLLQEYTENSNPQPSEVLSLLDADFADEAIRSYAVSRLEQFTDSEVMLYMLQLVQALKYEIYDDSPLLQFLFKRGIKEPKFLGHALFWQLMSEAHISHIQRRFSLIVMNFLYGIGSYTDELLKGYLFTQKLVKLNESLSNLSHTEALAPFQKALQDIEIPKEFHLPMDPRLVVESFIIENVKL